jgi:hypothetical protein
MNSARAIATSPGKVGLLGMIRRPRWTPVQRRRKRAALRQARALEASRLRVARGPAGLPDLFCAGGVAWAPHGACFLPEEHGLSFSVGESVGRAIQRHAGDREPPIAAFTRRLMSACCAAPVVRHGTGHRHRSQVPLGRARPWRAIHDPRPLGQQLHGLRESRERHRKASHAGHPWQRVGGAPGVSEMPRYQSLQGRTTGVRHRSGRSAAPGPGGQSTPHGRLVSSSRAYADLGPTRIA